ncbi:MAG TPA: hypothetical protein VEA35_00510 [Ramlibacter sp.]|nr:hypothetical protein [Ramlibacter sp.]
MGWQTEPVVTRRETMQYHAVRAWLVTLVVAQFAISSAAAWMVGQFLRYAPVIALSLLVVLALTVARLGLVGCR